MRRVYVDHSATTPVHPRVAAAMSRYMLADYGNASSVHAFGRAAREAVEQAREQVAELVGADPKEIIFTSGGTESDNLAILGAVAAAKGESVHVITSAVEHHAVLHVVDYLEAQGHRVTRVPVDSEGLVDPDDVKSAIEEDTVLVSIMMANNEVGTLQPIEAIAAITREHGVLLHTDAVQAVGQIPVDVNTLGVDLLSLSGHKMYGPKGVGALYVRSGTKLRPQSFGGHHERRLRAGTENVPGIVGLGEASALARTELDVRNRHLTRLRDFLIEGLEAVLPNIQLNGHRTLRLPNNVNISIRGIEGESILLSLDMKGVAASSGSACTSGSLEPSHCLLAMGLSHEVAHGSLRLTLGRENTQEDMEYVIEVLPEIVQRLRDMSPLM